MKRPFALICLLFVILIPVLVVAPSAGPAASSDGLIDVSGNPTVSAASLIASQSRFAITSGPPHRVPSGEVEYPITGPITPIPTTQQIIVPYTPTFRTPTVTFTPTFRTTRVTATPTIQSTTVITTPTSQPVTVEITPTTATATPTVLTTAITATLTVQPTASPVTTVTGTTTIQPTTLAATPTFQTPTVTYTPTFHTTSATVTPSFQPTTMVAITRTTATPTATATLPLYRNGPVYRYMINSGDFTSTLTITSNPSDAVITLDGYNSETTPFTYTEISQGYHTLEITYPGYEVFTRNIYMDTGTNYEIDADLTPLVDTGTLFVDSTPQGAYVYVDGNSKGQSPVTVDGLSAGLHQVELHLAGYEVMVNTENVIAGQETGVDYDLIPYSDSSSYGSINITSTIPGGLVYLDGIYKGITLSGNAFNIISVDPGPHTVLLHLPGYPDFTETVQVSPGQVSHITAEFTPATVGQPSPTPSPATTGGIVITSLPTGSQVYVDNQFRGVAPVTIYNVASGTHNITMNLAGYTNWSTSVDVQPNQMVQVYATLLPGAGTTPVPTRAGLPVLTVLCALAGCTVVIAIRMRK